MINNKKDTVNLEAAELELEAWIPYEDSGVYAGPASGYKELSELPDNFTLPVYSVFGPSVTPVRHYTVMAIRSVRDIGVLAEIRVDDGQEDGIIMEPVPRDRLVPINVPMPESAYRQLFH